MLPIQKMFLTSLFKNIISKIAYKHEKNKRNIFICPEIIFKHIKISSYGNISSNIAMKISKFLNINAYELAKQIVDELKINDDFKKIIKLVKVYKPGFINLYLSQSSMTDILKTVIQEKNMFGHCINKNQNRTKDSVILEFVSANPTGPLHVGHGRQAVLGDVIANILSSQGYIVHREFYYNDIGSQIDNLAISVQARAKGLTPKDIGWPSLGYLGEYISDIAQAFMNRETIKYDTNKSITGTADIDDINSIRCFSIIYIRNEQNIDLEMLGVDFDQFYLESSLYKNNYLEDTVLDIIKSGKTYELDGALWLKTSEYDDDKDRVMRKSNGNYTYFVSDIAYHKLKWERGFMRAINIQGFDHHGTIKRVRAGLQVLNLNIPIDYPNYILHKMVTVFQNNKEIKISKRAGNYVTLRDLIIWSGRFEKKISISCLKSDSSIIRGRDAVRFFLISRKPDTEFIFDIDLALKKSDENPVYYIQYAHARISSILSEWKLRYNGSYTELTNFDLNLLINKEEIELINKISEYPDILSYISNNLMPHKLTFYLRELASLLHIFYNSHRVLIDSREIRNSRISLIYSVKHVLFNGLSIIGVSAPDYMD